MCRGGRSVLRKPPAYLSQCFMSPRSTYQHMMAHVPAPPPVRLRPIEDDGPASTKHNRQKNNFDWNDEKNDHQMFPPVGPEPHPLIGKKQTSREQIRALRAKLAAERTARRAVEGRLAGLTDAANTPRGTAALTPRAPQPPTPRDQAPTPRSHRARGA